MRPPLMRALSVLVTLPATVVCSGAKVQDNSADTLMRAAYCVGVLKSAMRYALSDENRKSAKKACEYTKALDANNECWTPEGQLQNLEAKHRRYVGYVLLRTGGQPPLSVTVLMQKGERENDMDMVNLQQNTEPGSKLGKFLFDCFVGCQTPTNA